MLTTLGGVFLLVGIVLVILGYTVAPQAQRPGWGCVILGVVLLILGYLVPYFVTHPIASGLLTLVT